MLARIEEAWRRFLPCRDGLTVAQASRSGVAVYFSVEDLVAHLALWKNRTREVVETG